MPIGSKRDDASLLNNEYIRFDSFFGAGRVAARGDPVEKQRTPGAHAPSAPRKAARRGGPATADTGAGRPSLGAVHYDGLVYLVLPGGDPDLDPRGLWRAASESSGLTRYGSPGQPTLYAALDPSSATAETCYHALNDCRRDSEVLTHAMYQMRVRGRFADLHGRERHHPELIADDYRVTQRLAHRVRRTRLHGVLYPSARSNGFCLAAFSEHVVCAVRFLDFVTMSVRPDRTVRLCPAGSVRWRLLHRDDLRRSVPARS